MERSNSSNETIRRRKRLPSQILVLLPLVAFAAVATMFFTSYAMRDAGTISEPNQVPSALIDKSVPTFELPILNFQNSKSEETAVFSDLDLQGKVSIVNIWASWCAPCRLEHPILMELAKDTRFRIFGLNYKDKEGNALKFLDELGNPYLQVGIDKSGRTGIEWGVYGVPETYIVDSSGVIRFKFIGPLSVESLNTVFLPTLEKVIAQN